MLLHTTHLCSFQSRGGRKEMNTCTAYTGTTSTMRHSHVLTLSNHSHDARSTHGIVGFEPPALSTFVLPHHDAS
eukprot:m.365746 g.365746  ORF g.365746 m.365746 type:complete len:74 (-) comp32906_c0_seq1:418-639(-)